MREDNQIGSYRQKLWRDMRRQHLDKLLQEKRKEIGILNQKKACREHFDKIYPNISQDNFEEHRNFIKRYSYNNDYNFMLLPFVGYLYEYLISHPADEDCLLILESLTQFEDIELPQTEEISAIFINSLQRLPSTILNIVGNLLNFPKYRGLMRDYLIHNGFFSACQSLLSHIKRQNNKQQQEYIQFMVVFIYCGMIKTQPSIDSHYIELISQFLQDHQHLEENKYQIAEALLQISRAFAPNKQIGSIIYHQMIAFLQKQYFNYEQSILHFFRYCIVSQVNIGNKTIRLMLKSLDSSQKRAKMDCLICIKTICDKFEGHANLRDWWYDSLRNEDFIYKVMKTFQNSESSIKQMCAVLVRLIFPLYLQDIYRISGHCNLSQDQAYSLSNFISQCLSLRILPLEIAGLSISLLIVKQCKDNDKRSETKILVDNLQQLSCFKKVEASQFSQNDQIKMLAQQILHLWEHA